MTASPLNNDPQETNEQQPKQPSNRVIFLVLGFMIVSVGMAVALFFADSGQPVPGGSRPARVPQGGANAAVDWQVPDFSLPTLAGETVSITDYRGKIVFLNFWATWCVPCQREMPVFDEFMAEGRDDAVVLAVNNGETLSDVNEYVRLFRLDHVPILMDTDFKVADGFGVMNLPITYVIDAEGIVRYFKLGEITREDMDRYIAELQNAA